MKQPMHALSRRLSLPALALLGALALARPAAAAEWQSLFNGKDLDGWAGDPALWSVQDGAITGITREDPALPYNKFLVWKGGTVKNFELRATFRVIGNNNSGIQYRSAERPDLGEWVVAGYQADIHPSPDYCGMLYDEKGRGIIAKRGQKIIIDPDGKKWIAGKTTPPEKTDLEAWNELVIIAKGNHLIHQLNGKTTVEIIDHQVKEREFEGILAIQVHRGPAMRAQFKDIRLKTLPDGGVLSPAEAPVPAGAQSADAAPANRKAKGKGKGKGNATKAKKAPRPTAQAAPARDLDKANVPPSWIWTQEPARDNQIAFFRRTFDAPPGRIMGAKLYASCDNEMVVFLNGKKVAESKNWEDVTFADLKDAVQSGRNVLAVRARNAGGAAGLLVQLVIENDRQGDLAVNTDAQWRVNDEGGRGWQDVDHADADWKMAAVKAPLGGGPWTRINAAALANAGDLREPQATDPATLKVAKGFHVELLYSVPQATQGSWVSMTIDPQGRFIVSDQYGSLYRVSVPLAGQKGEVAVEKIDLDIGHAQGLLYAFDSIYLTVNDKAHGGRGLYRVQDTDGDDTYDKVTLLKKYEESGGEHGPHAVVLGPDKKSLYVVNGNQTALPDYNVSRVPERWGEDQLLPRIYGRGFMKGVLAPRGWVAKTDPEGKNWEIVATGFRNEYDVAFNRHGELFTYDADMEWDLNTPWYRPTRVCQVVSGAEFGWRNGSGKWPAYYPDSLPPVVNIGPGSPTGVTFGYGARFPAKYQEAFYICDWSYGKLYAVHLQPDGSTYTGTFEEFITGTPLPLTDLEVRPQDGALYFAIGGRRTQSGLYRVTYRGKESTAPSKPDNSGAEARALRHKLERFHGKTNSAAVAEAWPHLSNSDRFIRWAARTAIEHQPVESWRAKALKETQPQAAIEALVALARHGSETDLDPVLKGLDTLDWNRQGKAQKLALLRAYGLTFIRLGKPGQETASRIGNRLNAWYPAGDSELNAELCQLLVYLQHPDTARKSVALLEAAPSQEEQINFAKSLRLLKTGWNMDLRRVYFNWFVRAAAYRGGASFGNFVDSIKKDAVASLNPAERAALKSVIEAQPKVQSPLEALAAAMAGRGFVKEWTLAELAPKVAKGLQGRNYEQGRKMFGAAACFACHRFEGQGGATGPDLTGVAGRFSPRDLLESILDPSKVVSDQYAPVVITLNNGDRVTGRIVNLSGDSIRVNTNMFDPNEQAGVDRKKVVSIEPSTVSMMPEGLMNMLKEDEILDLMAYLLSGGNRNHPVFQ